MTRPSSTARPTSPAPNAATHSPPDLKVDWATHEAAKFACEHFHYSRCLPGGKLFKVGAWEGGKFIGVVIVSRGAAPNIGKPYQLDQTQIVELTRIALTDHAAPVTQIMSAAFRLLKEANPGLRLVVSYADPAQGHHGGIYQAGNWIYEGAMPMRWITLNGKLTHPKSIYAKYGTQSVAWLKQHVDPRAERTEVPSKHKYLMPLDRTMRKRVLPLAKPYPARQDRPPPE